MAEQEVKVLKTPDYTRRAVKNYRDKHDFLNITLDKGEIEQFKSVGMDVSTIRDLIRDEYKKRTESSNPMPKPTDKKPGSKITAADFDI